MTPTAGTVYTRHPEGPIVLTGLAAQTRTKLINRPRLLLIKQIASDTGLGQGFLNRLIANKVREPSAIKIEILSRYLQQYDAK